MPSRRLDLDYEYYQTVFALILLTTIGAGGTAFYFIPPKDYDGPCFSVACAIDRGFDGIGWNFIHFIIPSFGAFFLVVGLGGLIWNVARRVRSYWFERRC